MQNKNGNYENRNQGTMRIVKFEAAVLQTGTESTSAKENSGSVVLNLNPEPDSRQDNSKSL